MLLSTWKQEKSASLLSLIICNGSLGTSLFDIKASLPKFVLCEAFSRILKKGLRGLFVLIIPAVWSISFQAHNKIVMRPQVI